MRLFAYQGADGKDSVGALISASNDEFVDLCATDSKIPNHLQLIRSEEHTSELQSH